MTTRRAGASPRDGGTFSTSCFDTDNGKSVVSACGLAAFGLALSDRLDLSNAGDDYRRQFLRGNALQGLVQVTIGPALYVAMAGGLIATLGAVLASRDR